MPVSHHSHTEFAEKIQIIGLYELQEQDQGAVWLKKTFYIYIYMRILKKKYL